MPKVIVAVAPVGNDREDGVDNPLTPEQIAAQVIACAEAGASLVHLHVRDETGEQTADLAAFSRTLDLIRARSDIVIEASTGSPAHLCREERCTALDEPRVESASLNLGSFNLDDGVFANPWPDVRYWATRMAEAGVRPLLVAFDTAMVHTAGGLIREGLLQPPFCFAFPMGFRGGQPPSAEHLVYLRSLLPAGAAWGLVNLEMRDLGLHAVAAGLGASVLRVGFEDSIYWAPGRVAADNVELVERLVHLLDAMGLAPATPDEARKMLGV
jgi:3-keto-5-aminohexanoate cleavage enzyme